jgi:hypothetical protein
MEQRMPEHRRFTQTISLEGSFPEEAKRLRKQAQGTLPGIERERLVRRARVRDSFSHERVADLTRATGTKTRSIELAIYRLLQNSTMQPDEISRVTAAYEQALHTLCVKDRDDPLTEMIAKTIIKIAQTGVHDAAQLSALAIEQLGVR